MIEGPRLRPGTALWIWVGGVFVAVIPAGLSQRLDSSNLRDAAGALFLVLGWEALFKGLVLDLAILPVWGFRRLRRRKAENQEGQLRLRLHLMKLTVEALVEDLDESDSDPKQLQKFIDRLDELNGNFDA